MENAVLGIFLYVDTLLDAADRLRGAGHKVTILSSVPLVHEIEHKHGEGKGFLKYFTFFGGLAGFLAGVLLALGTAALYVLPRGGRAIFPITPTLLISYETAILGGVGLTFVGFLLLTGLPVLGKKKAFAPEIAYDNFGLVIEGLDGARFEEVEAILDEFGAHEVKRVEES